MSDSRSKETTIPQGAVAGVAFLPGPCDCWAWQKDGEPEWHWPSCRRVPTTKAAPSSKAMSIRERVASRTVQNVCELPGYTSPDDQPDLVMCTVQELEACVLRAFEEIAECSAVETTPDSRDAARYRWLRQARAVYDDSGRFPQGEALDECCDVFMKKQGFTQESNQCSPQTPAPSGREGLGTTGQSLHAVQSPVETKTDPLVLCGEKGPSGFICERPDGHPGRHFDGERRWPSPEKASEQECRSAGPSGNAAGTGTAEPRAEARLSRREVTAQKASVNPYCLQDGVPCASDGRGGCLACVDGKGTLNGKGD